MRDHVRFFLNGNLHTVRGDAAFLTLTDYLRTELGQVGTKVVCAEGDCGACTVVVGRPAGESYKYAPVDACILFVYQVDGAHVVTIEGLADGAMLHPVQQALVDHHGSQCGFCTPGVAMALTGWAEAGCPQESKSPRILLTGNLCRCTGYVSILEAATEIARTTPASLNRRYPPALFDDQMPGRDSILVTSLSRLFVAPTVLADAVAFKASHPDAVIVAGATELGVLRNKRGFEPRTLLSLSKIEELNGVEVGDREIRIGANASWTEIEAAVRDTIPEFHNIIIRFGSPQIRHVGTLAGNVANGSPIADSLGLLSVFDAVVEIAGPHGTRRRSINGFYTGYKKKDLGADELIIRIILPIPDVGERLRLTKVSRRNDLDIATVGSAIRIREVWGLIREAAVAFTGVAATVVRLPETEEFLNGSSFDESTFRQAGRIARAEIEPIDDVRGSRQYRLQLVENLLVKFFFDEMATNPLTARA